MKFFKLERLLLLPLKSWASMMTVAKESLPQSVQSAWLSLSLVILRMPVPSSRKMVNIWFIFSRLSSTWLSVTLVLSPYLASRQLPLWIISFLRLTSKRFSLSNINKKLESSAWEYSETSALTLMVNKNVSTIRWYWAHGNILTLRTIESAWMHLWY